MDAFRLLMFSFLLVLFLFLQNKFRLNEKKESFGHFASNFLHSVFSQIFLFIFFYSLGFEFYEFSRTHQLGAFYLIDLKPPLQFVITFLVFDLALYLQHRLSHKWKWLWRIHSVHHSDRVMSTSTALRFHFLEILISALWKGVVFVFLGASLRDFVIFEVFLSSFALFNHSNLRINKSLNVLLQKFLVTPELHRIHHSTDLSLSRTNFGFSVIFWDQIFGSFSAHQEVVEVGVDGLIQEGFWKQFFLKK